MFINQFPVLSLWITATGLHHNNQLWPAHKVLQFANLILLKDAWDWHAAAFSLLQKCATLFKGQYVQKVQIAASYRHTYERCCCCFKSDSPAVTTRKKDEWQGERKCLPLQWVQDVVEVVEEEDGAQGRVVVCLGLNPQTQPEVFKHSTCGRDTVQCQVTQALSAKHLWEWRIREYKTRMDYLQIYDENQLKCSFASADICSKHADDFSEKENVAIAGVAPFSLQSTLSLSLHMDHLSRFWLNE